MLQPPGVALPRAESGPSGLRHSGAAAPVVPFRQEPNYYSAKELLRETTRREPHDVESEHLATGTDLPAANASHQL